MLTENRQFIIPGKAGLHVDVTVNPIGELKVNVLEKNNRFTAPFEQLVFETRGKKTELLCKQDPKSETVKWHVSLTSDDARELAKLIEVAEDEYEALMRDL
ncbi:hypothetical protein L4C36_13130 [Photobacterium japonica]|uniref:hypothetical protein n=1 Tax=Photobacterium japonica TaxID=2910235 RepID=UPI003D142514